MHAPVGLPAPSPKISSLPCLLIQRRAYLVVVVMHVFVGMEGAAAAEKEDGRGPGDLEMQCTGKRRSFSVSFIPHVTPYQACGCGHVAPSKHVCFFRSLYHLPDTFQLCIHSSDVGNSTKATCSPLSSANGPGLGPFTSPSGKHKTWPSLVGPHASC